MPFREPEDLQDAPSGPSHSSSLGRLSKPDTDTPGLCGCGMPGPRGQRAPPRAPALGAPRVRGNPDLSRCSASNLRGSWARSRLGSLNLRGQLGSWTGSAENRKLHQVTAGQAQGGGRTVPRGWVSSGPKEQWSLPSASALRCGQAQPAAGSLNALSGNAGVCRDGRFVHGPWQRRSGLITVHLRTSALW